MNKNDSSQNGISLPNVVDSLRRLFEQILPWLVLALLLFYTHAIFARVPYAGIRYDPQGRVNSILLESDALQSGDLLRRVGEVTAEEVLSRNPSTYFFKGVLPGETIPIEIERNGRSETVLWRFPGFTWSEAVYRFNSPWWLAYVFWVAGTFSLFLIRPRDARWRLFIAFNFLTAIWLAAGTVSLWDFGNSRGVFRAAVWLSAPTVLHLHWMFPDPLPRWPRLFRLLAYLLAGGVATAGLFYLTPASFYWYGFLLVLGGSALIILWRLLFRPEQREEVGLLLGTVLLVLLPPAIVSGLLLLDQNVPQYIASGSLLALPAVPGAYFYILYRRQLGPRQERAQRMARIYVGAIVTSMFLLFLFDAVAVTLHVETSPLFVQLVTFFLFGTGAILGFAPFVSLPALAGPFRVSDGTGGGNLRLRANRLLAPFFFAVGGIILLAVTVLLLYRWLNSHLPLVAVALLALLWGRLAYHPLELAVDRYLLGIRLQPANLLESFAERITTTPDRDSLRRLLEDEVLPSLLVRQSALIRCGEDGQTEVVLSYGIEEPPSCLGFVSLVPLGTGQYPLPAQAPEWVRLVIPLRLGGQTIGSWFWGARDPDDLYRPEDVRMLQALANQTAIALTNILQAENLHALYQTHIDVREQERTRLARALHDEILSELAILRVSVEDAAPPFYTAYDNISRSLRNTISDLRPAMLNYGLSTALEEAVEDWQARVGEKAKLELVVNPANGRYPLQVEGHLFRIVQQAVENALEHAGGDIIRLEGSLSEEGVSLSVSDNGIGFPHDKEFTLRTLLAAKHFGLVGMYERAELIGATVAINTLPGEGTVVAVQWIMPGTA